MIANQKAFSDDLATKSEIEVVEIRAQARDCLYEYATTFSGLSHSVLFDRETAEVILRLTNEDLVRRGHVEGTEPEFEWQKERAAHKLEMEEVDRAIAKILKQLLPCPFCGRKVKRQGIGVDRHRKDEEGLRDMWIECLYAYCRVEVKLRTKLGPWVVEEWNTRRSPLTRTH